MCSNINVLINPQVENFVLIFRTFFDKIKNKCPKHIKNSNFCGSKSWKNRLTRYIYSYMKIKNIQFTSITEVIDIHKKKMFLKF